MRLARVSLLVALGCSGSAAGACESEQVDQQPDRVVDEFIKRMRRVHGDPEAGRLAYDLLWSEAKRNLAERAKRASAVTGRKVAPEEMLAPSRFATVRGPWRSEVRMQGDWAVVSLVADRSETPHEVKCVAEDGRWRLVLELPPLAPIRRRSEERPAEVE